MSWKSQNQKKKVFQKSGLGLSEGPKLASTLKTDFVCTPCSVLSARDPVWQQRKKAWLAHGIQSELGRDAKVFQSTNPVMRSLGETSIFDPVLCEVLYSWFCPPGGQIVDPFAGGSVRGLVASILGYRYWGVDLSLKQIQANVAQSKLGSQETPPTWVYGDAVTKVEKAPKADLLFSCPPYGNLEVYSDDPRDLSNKDYKTFLDLYTLIIQRAATRVKAGSYACWVVANFRDKKTGELHDLVGDTIRAFQQAGLSFYNDVIFVTPIASVSIRTRRIFQASRKLIRCHQNVLIFKKIDSKLRDLAHPGH